MTLEEQLCPVLMVVARVVAVYCHGDLTQHQFGTRNLSCFVEEQLNTELLETLHDCSAKQSQIAISASELRALWSYTTWACADITGAHISSHHH